ncbi:MAG: DUF4157 domain-containing protein [Myxococcales bacterium]
MPRAGTIQASFAERPLPAGKAHRRFARVLLPAHTATCAQGRSGSGTLPPHPATEARTSSAASWQGANRFAGATSSVRSAQRATASPRADVHAFQPPAAFLTQSGRGDPLPTSLRLHMERYFGDDLSAVRVHTGSEAESIGALAFTLGTDIYFAPSQYQPHTQYGRELLGHELTHVLQQREGRVGNPFGDGIAVVQDNDLEAEADAHGREAAKLQIGHRGYGGTLALQRKGAGDYHLHVGAYMHDGALHDGALPEPLAGHSFVAVEGPDGRRQAFGFSPAEYGKYDPQRDVGQLRRGVQGVVHDDANAFNKPGVRTQEYSITREQAQAALEKIQEYQSGRYRYSLDTRQCSTFALDVMKAAHVDPPTHGPVSRPRILYEALDGD